MKTFKNLFQKIISFENLLLAAHKAAKGKRENANVLNFFFKLEENLFQLGEELTRQSYRPGSYSTFRIYDPKPRMISAAPFRDRVVHHALINIIEPFFKRSFIFDSYANRVGKGTHKAIRRYQAFLRKYNFVLKCDIKKYFPSIDHEILKQLIRRTIFDQKTLWLLDTIIDGSNPQAPILDYFPRDELFTPFIRRKGLPIGNLTSQFFANVYLNPLDHFVKEELRCQGYLRYVDDFVLFGNLKADLWNFKKSISEYLENLRLKLHPQHCYVYPANIGWQFLGQKIFRTHRRLTAANVRKFRSRLKKWRKNPPDNLTRRLESWKGHASQANCHFLLKSLKLI